MKQHARKLLAEFSSICLVLVIVLSTSLHVLASGATVICDPVPETNCSSIIGQYTYSSNESLTRPDGSASTERTGRKNIGPAASVVTCLRTRTRRR